MTRLTLALAALLLALAAPTYAQDRGERNAPPGNSAIDEYVETVPGASGDRAPRQPASGSGRTTGALPPQDRRALEQQGPDGKALADLVEATGPSAPATKANRTPAASTRPAAASPAVAQAQSRAALARADREAASPLQATLTAAVGANDAGGLGVFFPVILLCSLLGMVALGVRRRRLPL